ncbi:MAG: copper uptake system-associated protein [Pseudomonadota bacterium]
MRPMKVLRHRRLFGPALSRLALAAVLALSISSIGSPTHAADSDEISISTLLHEMFDKPGEALTVEPVMVSSDHAIAGWVQGQMGGRALLRRQQRSWSIILCAGDGIKSREALTKAGVPVADALKLESDMIAAEARLAPEKVAMFSRFEGLVVMDGKENSAHHPHR